MWQRFKNWFKNTWLGKFFSKHFGRSTKNTEVQVPPKPETPKKETDEARLAREQQEEAPRQQAAEQKQREAEHQEAARQKQLEEQRKQDEARQKQLEEQRKQDEVRQKQLEEQRQQEAARQKQLEEQRKQEAQLLQDTHKTAIDLYSSHNLNIGACLSNSAEILGITEEERQSLLTEVKAYKEQMAPVPQLDRYHSKIPPLAELQKHIAIMENAKALLTALKSKIFVIDLHFNSVADSMDKLWDPVDNAQRKLEDSQNRLYDPNYDNRWSSNSDLDEEDRDEFCQKNYALRDEAKALTKIQDVSSRFAAKDRLTQCLKDIESQIAANQDRKAAYSDLKEQIELKLSLATDYAALIKFAGDKTELKEAKKNLQAFRDEIGEISNNSRPVDAWITRAKAALDQFDQRTAELIKPVMRMVVHREVVKRVAQELKADTTHPQASLLAEISEEELIHFLNLVAKENEWLFAEGLDSKDVNIDLQPESPKPPKKDGGSDAPPPVAPAYCYVYVYKTRVVEEKSMAPMLNDVYWHKVRKTNSEVRSLLSNKEIAVAKKQFKAVLEKKPAQLTFKTLIESIVNVLRNYRYAKEEKKEEKRKAEEKAKAKKQKKEVRYAYAN